MKQYESSTETYFTFMDVYTVDLAWHYDGIYNMWDIILTNALTVKKFTISHFTYIRCTITVINTQL